MSNPTASDVHVNTPLTNISVAYVQDEGAFVADKVFPVVPVQKQGDRYYVYSKADLMRIDVQERAPSTESAGSGYDLDNTPTYFAKKYALHKDIDDDMRANQDSVLDADRDATTYLTQNHMMKRDKVFTAAALAGSIWTGSTGIGGGADGADLVGAGAAGSNAPKYWSSSGSTPIQDVETQKTGLLKATGRKANVMVVGTEVWAYLRNHADILARIQYSQLGLITEDLVAKVFGIEKLIVAEAVENTAKKGQTASMSFITGKHALLCHVTKSPSLLTPTAGYIFGWKGLLGASAYAPTISKFRMEHLKSDRVEAEMAFDIKVVCPDLGVFFQGIVA